MKKISIIIPVHNEEKNIPLIHAALRDLWKDLSEKYEQEIIFVNDGSRDNSEAAILAICNSYPEVRSINFARNFGKEIATTAGIHAAAGDAAIMIDADLQHPVQLIPAFLRHWENGAEVVVGVRSKNKKEGLVKKLGSVLYYWIMNLISETKLVPGETDFRLIDRQVIDAFREFTEHQRMTRALINWLGFPQEYVVFEANERANGQAPYSFFKLLHLATHSFISHSLFPLKLAGYLGMIITFSSGVLGVVVFIERYVFNDVWRWNPSGTAQLAIILLFLVGILLACLGLVALYIGNIQGEVANRPLYVVKKERK
jgi:glycosyltransferase involved in cell wall biosynthesis